MKLRYAKLQPGNFGDELNSFIWPCLFPNAFDTDDNIDFIGIGTILSRSLASNPGRRKIVFGTGAGYWRPPIIDDSWKIFFVRGPRTAELLNLPRSFAITDAAYCFGFANQVSSKAPSAIVLVPHHQSELEVDWTGLCAELGFKLIRPTLPVETVLNELRSARLVIAEAMHGAIMADLFRIPWIPIRYGFRSLDLKWHDWCESMSMTYEPVDMPPLLDLECSAMERFERMARKACGLVGIGKSAWRSTPVFRTSKRTRDRALHDLYRISTRHGGFLSREPVWKDRMDQLWEQVERMRGELESRAI
jgi:succinoglycan biosynthesis protein ExoV